MVSSFGPELPLDPTAQCELEALEPTRLISIGREEFRGELRRDPVFAIAMADALHHQHAALVTRLSAMQLPGSVERTAATVAGLAREFAHRCPLSTGFTMPVSQQLIADLAGLSRQTANRALVQLRLARLVFSSRGFICALDLAGLDDVAWAGVPPATRKPVCRCKLLQPDQSLDCDSAGSTRARQSRN
ncbi:MAG: Crp/Fnr family transcriptional regulator [Gemmatimonadota bacterium]